MGTAQLILALLSQAPQAITEITALYNAVKSDISATDQQQIDAALASAQQSDAAATAQADTDLAAAAEE
jgi:hypothetical protein